MAEITRDTEKLLDRLYNLQGSDNIVIKGIEEDIKTTTEHIKNVDEEQKGNELKKVECEGKLALFECQRDTFQNAFAGLDDDTFSALREIDVDIRIGSMLEAISEKAPIFCDELKKQITSYQDAVNENARTIENLTDKMRQLRLKADEAEYNRNQLISLIEQCLSEDEIERESLTTNYVKKVVSVFGVFTPEEISSLTKLIIFPDEGLFAYAQNYQERLEKGLVNIDDDPIQIEEEQEEQPKVEDFVEETTETPEEVEEEMEEQIATIPIEETVNETYETKEPNYEEKALEMYAEPVVEDNYEVTEETTEDEKEENIEMDSSEEEPALEPIITFDAEEDTNLNSLNGMNFVPEENDEEEAENPFDTENNQEYNEETTEDQEPVEEIVLTPSTAAIEEFLKSINIDPERFAEENEESKETILENISKADERVIEGNYELLRSLNVDNSVAYKFYENHSYLSDNDLNKKITLLRVKNVSENKIKDLIEVPSSGMRDTLETIEARLKAIEAINGKIDDENVNQIAIDVNKYEENYNILVDNGFDLEEKELRNYLTVLAESEYIPDDIEVLKNYLISIVRKNGKYALSIFWKKPLELLKDIDDIIESDLENMISTNPEVLSYKTDMLLKRVNYCLKKGYPLTEANDSTSYCNYIITPMDFAEEFGASVTLPELVESTATNEKLRTLIGNEDLIDILDNYYNNMTDFKEITVSEDMNFKLNDLKSAIMENMSTTNIGKYTYKIEDACISRNKFERNLCILINSLTNNGQEIEGLEKEIILTASLYNTRLTEEQLEKVIESYNEKGGNE